MSGRVHQRTLIAAALALLVVCGLGGCASLQAAAVGSAMDRMLPGQPVVNSYTFQRLPFGPWAALSVWRVNGPPGTAALEAIDRWLLEGIGPIEVVAPAAEVEHMRARLEGQTPGCGSPRGLLVDAAARAADTLRFVRQPSDRVPRLRLIAVPPGQGHAGLDVSLAGTFQGVEMSVATQLPESRTCPWLRYWAAQVLDTLYHELFHAWRFSRHGQADDLLREEFVAYAIGDCAARLADPEQRPRVRTFPGLQDMPTSVVVDATRSGKIPPTIAGRFLAHLQGPAQDAGPGDAWRQACARLADDSPAVSDQ